MNPFLRFYNLTFLNWSTKLYFSTVSFIALISLIILYSYIQTHLTKTALKLNKFGGGWIVPIFGNCLLFLRPTYQIQDSLSSYISKYGRVCRFWRFHKPRIIIAEASACEKILSSSKIIDKGSDYFALENMIKNGIVMIKGERWRRDRKLLNPAFNRAALTSFMPVFNKQARILVNKLDKRFESSSEATNVFPLISLAAFEIIFQTALGIELNLQNENEESKCSQGLEWLCKSIQFRLFKPWITSPIIWKLLGYEKVEENFLKYFRSLVRLAINRQIKEISTKSLNKNGDDGTTNKNFIDTLLQSDFDFTEQEIVDHLLNIVGGGSETVSFSVNVTLFYLALHPDCQAKLFDELNDVFSDVEPNEEITIAHLSQVKYLEMCWKEAMRLSPSAPIISRQLSMEIQLENGLTMPKGSDAVFLIHDLHRDPSVFPNPEEFNPERFLPDEVCKRSVYSYLPFSMGVRNCIGHKFALLEAKITLINILRNFEVMTLQKQSDIKYILGVPSEPHPAIKLAFKRRSKIFNGIQNIECTDSLKK